MGSQESTVQLFSFLCFVFVALNKEGMSKKGQRFWLRLYFEHVASSGDRGRVASSYLSLLVLSDSSAEWLERVLMCYMYQVLEGGWVSPELTVAGVKLLRGWLQQSTGEGCVCLPWECGRACIQWGTFWCGGAAENLRQFGSAAGSCCLVMGYAS